MGMLRSKRLRVISAAAILGVFFVSAVPLASADTISELKQKISQRTSDIKSLEDEITQYESQLSDIAKQKDSLSNKVQSLELTQKKLETDIAVTQKKIDQANLQIDTLSFGITGKEQEITDGKHSLAQAMRTMNEDESKSLVEIVLSNDSLSSFLDDINSLAKLQSMIQANIEELKTLKTDLEGQRTAQQEAKAKLVKLENQLDDQKQIVVSNKKEQQTLLSQTKNKESNYQAILSEKKKLKEAFEQELLNYQSQLKVAIDPNSYPAPGTQVLAWPLDHVRITQYFGDTAFAKSGAYNGKGHNGVDFAASVGTPLKAGRQGFIVGTGNTDLTCQGASYGKWVLIQYDDGLSSIYAHLSLIKVKKGDTVKTGDVIGYSGDTGYVTGPHLHLGVYATQGVKISQLKSKVCNATYTMPLAPFNGYLNPLDYLPKYTGPAPL